LVGDPVEYESIRSTFTGSWRQNDLFLGGVKDNIGHAEAASGAAGIVKCLLMMQHKTIPKQASFTTLNPRIRTTPTDRIVIPQENTPWASDERVALINNYGASGSIVALILREHVIANTPTMVSPPAPSLSTKSYPMVLAAKSISSLEEYIKKLKLHFRDHEESVGAIAYNLARQQNPSLEYRIAFTATDSESFLNGLDSNLNEIKLNTRLTESQAVVLCFGGQTGQTINLSRRLFDSSELLRTHLVR
jgi:acyl transferase domain-containing protein